VKSGLATAGRDARTMVERIDSGILADVVIKATALQEKANARLCRKGSMYLMGEIQVTASLPPGISFSIERVGDADHDEASGDPLLSSTELLAEGRAAEAEAIVSLDTRTGLVFKQVRSHLGPGRSSHGTARLAVGLFEARAA